MRGARYYFVHHPCGHQTPVPGTWFLGDRTVDFPCSACREPCPYCGRPGIHTTATACYQAKTHGKGGF